MHRPRDEILDGLEAKFQKAGGGVYLMRSFHSFLKGKSKGTYRNCKRSTEEIQREDKGNTKGYKGTTKGYKGNT